MRLTVASLKTLKTFFDQLKDAYPKATNVHLIFDQGPYKQRHPKAAKERGIKVHYLPFPTSPNLPPIFRLNDYTIKKMKILCLGLKYL
ncbi:hypothetical protein HE1_00871 [Holospora elegans E1]|uniref:Tc1-like transposase DDE domain-containing protein n=1 Tax=Holospora elegans E1 TaxID=1427503 RepID=A0A023DYJ7_9PROT|nr:hypothetical protein HE1_00871 [Holospora elegans E1]